MPAAAFHMGFDYPPPEQLIYPEWNVHSYPIMEQYIPQQLEQQQQHSSHSNQHQHPHSHSQSLPHVNQIIPSQHVQSPLDSSYPRAPSNAPTVPFHSDSLSSYPSSPSSLTSHPHSHSIDLDPSPSMPSPLNYNPKAFTFQTLPTPYIDIHQQQQQQQQQHHGFTTIPQPVLSTSPHISPQYVASTSPQSHEKVVKQEQMGKKRKTSVASTPVVPTQPVTPPISRPVIHVRHGDGPGFERNQRFLSEKDATSFSCHHCKVKRSRDQLLFCHATIQIETYKAELTHVIPKPRNEKKRKPKKTNLPIYHCAKRYCHGCMKKHYLQNVNEMDVEQRICFICPSCEEDCACSECSRKLQRRSISPIISHLKHLQLTYGLSHIAKTLLHTRRCDEPLPIPSSPMTPNTQDDPQLVKYEIPSLTSHDESHTSSPHTHTSSSCASSQPISSDPTNASWIQSLLTPLPNIFPSIPLPSSAYVPHYPLIDYSSTSTSTSTSTESSTASTPPQHTHALRDMIIHRPSTSHIHPSQTQTQTHPHPFTSHSHSHPPTHSRSTSHPHPSDFHSQSHAPHHHKRGSLDHMDEETTKRIRVKRNNKK